MIAATTPFSLDESRAAILRGMAKRMGIPGLCVVLTSPTDQAILLHGVDEAGSGRPVTPQTWFQAASTGKHVTASIMLDLTAAGRVDLSAPIGTYLDSLPPAWAQRSVTALLHHVSGLPDYLTYAEGEVPPTTRADFMALSPRLEPIAAERTTWNYSNTNYILLGLIADAVTGRTGGVLTDEMFARLGIGGARAGSPDWVRAANAGRVDRAAPDMESRQRVIYGDGDIAFTADGALAWLRALLDGRAPGAASLFEPYRPQGPGASYGCGWFLERMGDARLAHHAGHYDGWTAMALLNRSRGCGVIALCNLAPRSTRAIRSIALRALEDFDAGATPLALTPIMDERPDLTGAALQNLVRDGAAFEPAAFAPEMLVAGADGGRGIVNLWRGAWPVGFDLVEDDLAWPRRVRRYRLTYTDGVEHLIVETDAEDRIAWAWPL